MSRSGGTAEDGVDGRYSVPGERIGTRGGTLLVAAGVVGLYRPLTAAVAALDAVSSQFAPAVGGGLLAFAAVVALWGARGAPTTDGTLGAGLVGGTLLGALVVVGLLGDLALLGPGVLAVGLLATVATAAMTGVVAVWTVRGARSRLEAIAFGAPAAFPVFAGPYFAAFAPETVPVPAGGSAGVLALAAGVVLAVGVAHGLYRRSLRLAAATDSGTADDRTDTREV